MATSSLATLDSSSPYPQEPARRIRRVDTVVSIARRISAPYVSPHLYGGSGIARAEFEYARAADFWEIVGRHRIEQLLTAKDMLDVGCGWGGKIVAYAEAGARSVKGFDLPGVFDPAIALEFARDHGVADRAEFTVGYAESIPYSDECVDTVLMEDVLEHVQDPAAVLAECWRVLRPGGWVVARFPSFRMLTAHHLDRAIHLPGAHYLMPLRTWHAGLNAYRERLPHAERFEPFAEIVDSAFRRGTCSSLNGMSFAQFADIVRASSFRVEHLGLLGYPRRKFGRHGGAAFALYRLVSAVPALDELLARTVVFVAEKVDA